MPIRSRIRCSLLLIATAYLVLFAAEVDGRRTRERTHQHKRTVANHRRHDKRDAERTQSSTFNQATRTFSMTPPPSAETETTHSSKPASASTGSGDPLPAAVTRAPESPSSKTKSKTRASNRKRSRGHFREVKIKQGKIRGRVIETSEVGRVYAFLGVPYAESPTGRNRFKRPVPVRSWKNTNTTRDALEYPNSCHQWRDVTFENYAKGFRGTAMWNTNTNVSEDCLYVNVWSPSLPRQRKRKGNLKAVMVWIYGGGFYSGTSSLAVYNGVWLAGKENVVVVSMNYRVAGLGFLALDGKEIPGNAGLFDQHLALKWVQENIHHFGGDRGKVTMFGESAGAASITLHMMSKKSRGLFHNVILQSASALSPWSILNKKEAKRRALKLAWALNCTGRSNDSFKDFQAATGNKVSESLVSCLQTVDPQNLVDTEMELESYGTARFPNAAVVDGRFLEISPHDPQSIDHWNTDVNVLGGFNANEGNYFLVYASKPAYDLASENFFGNGEFESGIAEALRSMIDDDQNARETKKILAMNSHFMYTSGYEPIVFDADARNVTKEPYVPGGERYSLHNDRKLLEDSALRAETFYRDRLDDMVGDINFVCPTIAYLDRYADRLKAKNGSRSRPRRHAYLYKFVHRSSQNPWPEWMGVMHGYEIEFVFGLPLDRAAGYSELERNISLSMMKMWAHFAKEGRPTGDNVWPPYNEKNKYIFIIGERGKDEIQGKASLYSKKYSSQLTHCSFWRKHYPAMQQKLNDLQSPCTCPKLNCSTGAGYSVKHSALLLLVVAFTSILAKIEAIY